jgi:hypothetical protein
MDVAPSPQIDGNTVIGKTFVHVLITQCREPFQKPVGGEYRTLSAVPTARIGHCRKFSAGRRIRSEPVELTVIIFLARLVI